MRHAATAGAAAVAVLVALTSPVDAEVTLAAASQLATWATPSAGESGCSNLGSVSVQCRHAYQSQDLRTGADTCGEAGTGSVGVGTCRATLTGWSSGPGRAVGETVAACNNTAIGTLTFQFRGAAGTYPSFPVNGTVEQGDGSFAGTSGPVLHPALGLVVQSATGKFTMGCGPGIHGIGSFTGSWTLKSVV